MEFTGNTVPELSLSQATRMITAAAAHGVVASYNGKASAAGTAISTAAERSCDSTTASLLTTPPQPAESSAYLMTARLKPIMFIAPPKLPALFEMNLQFFTATCMQCEYGTLNVSAAGGW